MEMKAERIVWIDGLKGLLIALVVLGHVAGSLFHYVSGNAATILGCIYKLIYLFHIPAFFMVAGYMYVYKGAPLSRTLKKRFLRLLVPYFFWGSLSIIIFLLSEPILGHITNGGDVYYSGKIARYVWYRPFLSLLHAGEWPAGEGFRCNSVLWFLPCMFVVLLAYDLFSSVAVQFCAKRHLNIELLRLDVAILFVMVILGAIIRFYCPPYLPWGLSRAPYMMIFFLLGRVVKICKMRLVIECRMVYLGFGWLAYGFIVWLYPDLASAYFSWWWYLFAAMIAIMGIYLAFLSMYRISPSWLVKIGEMSLGIMLVHKFFILPFQVGYHKIAAIGICVTLVSVMCITGIVLVASYMLVAVVIKRIPWSVGIFKYR